jgi:uncharacterized protein YbjT (DUF2867 family)
MTVLKRLLLLGGTGAVGHFALRQALLDARIAQVVAPTRRPLPAHPKLENPVIDFTGIGEETPWLQADAVLCALGTTLKLAGSKAAFTAIDRDLPIRIAALTRPAGATRFALNSSTGAAPRGSFYLRTKYEAEAGIRALGYPIYTIVRPSIIDTERAIPRPAERLALLLMRALRPLIPARYRAVKAERIAQALIAGVLREDEGERIVESEML